MFYLETPLDHTPVQIISKSNQKIVGLATS